VSMASIVDFGINPYVGGGSVSDGSKVQSATGLRANFVRGFRVNDRLSLGPRVEIGNNYINTKSRADDRRILSTYDNRYLVGGAQLGVAVGPLSKFRRDVYLSFAGGRAMSKLNQDETGTDYYARKKYSQLKGTYYASEIGTNIQVRRDIAFNVSLLSSFYRVDARKSVENASGEIALAGGKTFELNSENSVNRVPDRITQKLYFLSFGLTVGI
jgi:hypothetical protein